MSCKKRATNSQHAKKKNEVSSLELIALENEIKETERTLAKMMAQRDQIYEKLTQNDIKYECFY